MYIEYEKARMQTRISQRRRDVLLMIKSPVYLKILLGQAKGPMGVEAPVVKQHKIALKERSLI